MFTHEITLSQPFPSCQFKVLSCLHFSCPFGGIYGQGINNTFQLASSAPVTNVFPVVAYLTEKCISLKCVSFDLPKPSIHSMTFAVSTDSFHLVNTKCRKILEQKLVIFQFFTLNSCGNNEHFSFD